MKSNKNVIIVVIVSIVVIACVAIGRSGNTSAGGNISASYDSTISNNSVTIPTYPNDTYQTTQSYIPAQSSSYSYDYQYQTTEAAQWKGTGKSGHVSYITPDDAGLNVRSKAGADGTLLTTLPEGTYVFYYPQTQADGYVYCEFTHNNIINGWVLASYVMDDTAAPQTTQAQQTTQTSFYNSSMGISAPGFVSYNTPDNAGLNVRNAPSSEAALLTTLPEGEKLMYFPDSIQNGYIYCELSGLTGGILYGWLLAEYVMVE